MKLLLYPEFSYHCWAQPRSFDLRLTKRLFSGLITEHIRECPFPTHAQLLELCVQSGPAGHVASNLWYLSAAVAHSNSRGWGECEEGSYQQGRCCLSIICLHGYVRVRVSAVRSEGSHAEVSGQVLPVCVLCDAGFLLKKSLGGKNTHAHFFFFFANIYVTSGDSRFLLLYIIRLPSAGRGMVTVP